MVPSKKFPYDFKRKHNVNDTGKNLALPIHSIVAYINEGLQIWFRNRISVAQTNSRVRNELKPFKEDFVELPLVKIDGGYMAKYPADLHTRLNQIVVATKEDCGCGEKEIIPRIIESDDLHEARFNPYRQPDYFYEQLLAVESKDGLIIYTDDVMELKSLKIDYYRRPKDIHFPSYEECTDLYYLYDGSVITKDQNFEGDVESANDIIDIAVSLASFDTKPPNEALTRLNFISQLQVLYK